MVAQVNHPSLSLVQELNLPALQENNPQMKLQKLVSIPVVTVLFSLCFIYYVTVFVFIQDWLGLRSSAGSLNALILSFFVLMCIFSFFTCVLTDPGGIPSSYTPDVERNGSSDQEFQKNGSHKRHCDKCSASRPPRTHHCRVCRRCIMKMDHHCIWINNCVGHGNYKPYLTLVLYAFVSSTYSMVMIICSTFWKDWDFGTNHPLKVFYIGCGLLTLGLSFTLGTLLGWHVYLTAHNLTTIEYHEAKRAAWLARKSGLSYHHPYDVGVYKNITLVLGPNMLKWLWPASVSHIKDGLSFPTARDSS